MPSVRGLARAAALFWSAVLILSSCNGALGGSPSAPADVAASQGDYEDKIEVTWTAPPHAGVYHVYRGSESGFSVDDDSYLDSTSYTTFIDTEIETEDPFYYAVAAANIYGENESTPSAEASGYIHLFRWSMAETIGTGIAETAVAVDGDGVLHAATVSSADGSISAWYDDEGTLTAMPAPASGGTAASTTAGARVLDMAYSGTRLFLAYVDADSDTGIVIREYDEEEETWGSFGGAFSNDTARFLHIEAGNGNLYAAFISGDVPGEPQVWSAPLTGLAVWSQVDASRLATLAGSSCTGISFTLAGGTPTILCETGTPSVSALQYANSAWSALGGTGSTIYSGDPINGSAALAWDSDREILYAAYGTAAGSIGASQLSGSGWTDISPTGAALCNGRVELAIRNGTLALIYGKSLGNIGGHLYDPETEEWTETTSSDRVYQESGDGTAETGGSFTGSAPALAAEGLFLYCAFTDGGDGMLRRYE